MEKKMTERNLKTLGNNTGNPGLLLAPEGEELHIKRWWCSLEMLKGPLRGTKILPCGRSMKFFHPYKVRQAPPSFLHGSPPPPTGLLTPTFLLLPVIRDISDPPSQYFVNPRGKDRAKLQNTGNIQNSTKGLRLFGSTSKPNKLVLIFPWKKNFTRILANHTYWSNHGRLYILRHCLVWCTWSWVFSV